MSRHVNGRISKSAIAAIHLDWHTALNLLDEHGVLCFAIVILFAILLDV